VVPNLYQIPKNGLTRHPLREVGLCKGLFQLVQDMAGYYELEEAAVPAFHDEANRGSRRCYEAAGEDVGIKDGSQHPRLRAGCFLLRFRLPRGCALSPYIRDNLRNIYLDLLVWDRGECSACLGHGLVP